MTQEKESQMENLDCPSKRTQEFNLEQTATKATIANPAPPSHAASISLPATNMIERSRATPRTGQAFEARAEGARSEHRIRPVK